MPRPVSGRGIFMLRPGGTMTNTLSVLTELADERARQDAKHGFPSLPDGTGQARVNLAHEYEMMLEDARELNDSGRATWESVLREEVCEAMLETDPAKIR